MKKAFYFLFSALALIVSSTQSNAQINTATGGATSVVANSPTTNTNVGIGTNVPKSKLDVKGALTVGATYGGLNAAPTSGAIIEGNVGIGTAAPSAKLEVKSGVTDASGLKLTNLLSTSATVAPNGKALSVDATGSVVLVPSAASASGIDADATLTASRTMTMSGKNYTFNPSNLNSQFFINGITGNTGIGTITPSSKLEIASGTAGNSGLKFTNLLNTNATVAGNGTALSVDATGNVVLVPVVNAAPVTTNIYNTNGALTAARTVTMAGNSLVFNPTNNASFTINGANGDISTGGKLEVLGNIVAGATSSTQGVNAFSVKYGANGTLSNWGSLYSSSASYMGYGVKAAVGTSGWVSSDPLAIGKSAMSSDGEGVHFYTAPSQSVANNSAISMSEVLRIDNSGNVGIGTTTPSTKLEVKSGVADTAGLKFTNLTNASATVTGNNKALSVDATGNVVLVPVVSSATTTNTLYSNNGTLADNRTVGMNGKNLTFATAETSGTPLFFVNGTNGRVGIGTNIVNSKLEIAGLTNGQTFVDFDDAYRKSTMLNIGSYRQGPNNDQVNRLFTFADLPVSNINTKAESWFSIEDRNDANRFRHYAQTDGTSSFALNDKTQSQVFGMYEDGTYAIFTFDKPGSYVTIGGKAVWPIAHNFWVKTGTSKFNNDVFVDTHIGIGTDKFIDIADNNKEYKLSVRGRVRAEEVKVYNTWADYVFNKDYQLPTLTEVEKYIAQNKHLPNVPSAKEVTEKGLELGEMAKIQQEKIEELTLYLIQQNKQIEELKAQVKLLMEKK